MNASAPFSAAEVRTTLSVGGMTCDNCVRHVEEALAGIPGVRAMVDLAAATAVVTHDASVPVDRLLAVVDEAGYEVAVAGAAA
jgi:P-type Cu+ transporter